MRTTVEITDAQREKLLALAARRGQKGFSTLIQDALDLYLANQDRRSAQVQAAVALSGSFSDEAADALEQSVVKLRSAWR